MTPESVWSDGITIDAIATGCFYHSPPNDCAQEMNAVGAGAVPCAGVLGALDHNSQVPTITIVTCAL